MYISPSANNSTTYKYFGLPLYAKQHQRIHRSCNSRSVTCFSRKGSIFLWISCTIILGGVRHSSWKVGRIYNVAYTLCSALCTYYCALNVLRWWLVPSGHWFRALQQSWAPLAWALQRTYQNLVLWQFSFNNAARSIQRSYTVLAVRLSLWVQIQNGKLRSGKNKKRIF